MRRMLEVKDIELVNLMEARKNPELNPKISAYEALKPYSEDENYFISFTAIDKLGINPSSKYDTPLAIYTYPLKTIWKEYRVDSIKSVGKAVPFAGNSPYVWLVKVKNNVNFVRDMYTDYTSKEYDKDIKTLNNHILSNQDEYQKLLKDANGNLEDIGSIIDIYFIKWTKEAKERNAIMSMWNITRNLAYYRQGKPAVQWSYLLHRVLGYGGFADVSGRGYIHPSEPIQACFFSTRSFDVVAEFLNKDYTKGESWLDLGIKNKTINAENSKFFVDKDNLVIWSSGTWIDGTWQNGIWKNGFWIDGVWKDGFWKDGVWKNGVWEFSFWENGTWENGIWKNGTWDNGIWKLGTWKDGSWKNGTWEDGIWEDGFWYDGIWKKGTWKYGIWSNGTWKKGIWKGGLWKFGTWENGTWEGGLWEKGTWLKGKIFDPDRKGHFSPTNKWDGDYVETKLNPKQYFEGVK